MLIWFAKNAATILITAALAALVFFIVRGMVRGKIGTCGDCGGNCGAACGACEACEACGACGHGPGHKEASK